MNWLLIVVLILLIVGAVAGYVKGFVDTVYSLIATLLIIILTIVLCPFTVKALQSSEKLTTFISQKVDGFVNLEEAYDKASKSENSAKTESKTPDTDSVLESYGLPSILRKSILNGTDYKDYIKNSADSFARDKIRSLEKFVCDKLSNLIISAMGFVITFIVVAILVFFLGKILDLISKIPGVHKLDQVLGGCAGFLEALLVIWIAFTIVTLIASTGLGKLMMDQITSSKILDFIYEHNFISKKLFSLIK